MASAGNHSCLQFEEFLLDPADERLIGPVGPIRLGNKAYHVLLTLAGLRGRLLTKEELFESVWDGTIVSESALTSVIKELRRALGDESRNPRFIESVYGRGYRFIAPVNEVASRAAPTPADEPASRICVCVLPFTNISGDLEQDYFSDGITDDVTTDLSKVSALQVIARNTAFQFKGQAVDIRETASKLGATHVLEGSVRKAQDRIRISAQLIDGRTGAHLWAERYDRELTDIFAIQDEISHAIVGALKINLLPEEKQAIERRGTNSAEAYNLYLMARQIWIAGNHGDRRREERVIRICERAVAIDPRYARAWALLAIAQSTLHYGLGFSEVADGVEVADRALSIDPAIAEAFCPRARRAAEQGRDDEAEEAIHRALELDGSSWEVNKEAARFYYLKKQFETAARHYDTAASVMETDYHACGILLSCHEALGNEDGKKNAAALVVQRVERVLQNDPYNGHALSMGAAGLAVLGKLDRCREWIERALLIDPDNVNMRFNLASTLAMGCGDVESAMPILERAFADAKGPFMIKLTQIDPDLDCFRGDARFTQMLAKAEKRFGLEPLAHSA
ncbi:MAG TPA: winged helix-turn-helix domain-containing protein [Sphingomicrobium sp.]|nr:winged helix-turn-helix domain-containing protein [Sphingomicrobium sp.]